MSLIYFLKTVSLLRTFVLAMLKHPDIQAKTQAELDPAVGHGRLPTFEDQESLLYLSAVVKECLRWELVAPFAVPHMLTADDEYRGFILPKGALIIPNSYGIVNDEEAYQSHLYSSQSGSSRTAS